jgi:hypothetical protein
MCHWSLFSIFLWSSLPSSRSSLRCGSSGCALMLTFLHDSAYHVALSHWCAVHCPLKLPLTWFSTDCQTFHPLYTLQMCLFSRSNHQRRIPI